MRLINLLRSIFFFSVSLRLCCIAICFMLSVHLYGQEKLSKAEYEIFRIDSIFSSCNNIGFNTSERLKYTYHFSDRERLPIIEMSKGLERDSIETISYYEENDRWYLSAFENAIYTPSLMLQKEKEFRWMMYKYKVDNYHGFTITTADIDVSPVPDNDFLPFILSLSNADLYKVGMRLDKVENYQKSIFVFDELIKRAYKLDTSYYKMGKALIGTHEYVDGIKHLQKALELNPDYFDIHMDLGKIYYENSHWKLAHHHFLEAYRLNYNDDVVLYHLSKTMIKVGRYKEAYTVIQRAVKLNPKNIYAKGVLDELKSPAMRKLRKKSEY